MVIGEWHISENATLFALGLRKAFFIELRRGSMKMLSYN